MWTTTVTALCRTLNSPPLRAAWTRPLATTIDTTLEDGTCEFAQEGFDCDGNCVLGVKVVKELAEEPSKATLVACCLRRRWDIMPRLHRPRCSEL